MGAAIGRPLPTKLMKLWNNHRRPPVRDAEVGWKSAKPFLSSSLDPDCGWSALTLDFCWVLQALPTTQCRAASAANLGCPRQCLVATRTTSAGAGDATQ